MFSYKFVAHLSCQYIFVILNAKSTHQQNLFARKI